MLGSLFILVLYVLTDGLIILLRYGQSILHSHEIALICSSFFVGVVQLYHWVLVNGLLLLVQHCGFLFLGSEPVIAHYLIIDDCVNKSKYYNFVIK